MPQRVIVVAVATVLFLATASVAQTWSKEQRPSKR